MIELKLQPGEQKQQAIEHRYLRVLFASAPVVLSSSELSSFEVRNKQTVDMEKPRTVLISNKNAQEVIIRIEPTPVRVYELDAVELADGATVSIAPGSAIDVGEVTMAADAEIAIKTGSSVAINNFPVNQLVTVDNMPTTQTVDGQVNIGTMPKVKKDASGSYNGLSSVAFNVNQAQTIAGNTNRKEIHLKTDITNTGNVWVGATALNQGIPLGPGEAQVFEVSADLQVYGAVTTDKLYLAEVTE